LRNLSNNNFTTRHYVTLKIYGTRGEEVVELVSGNKAPGKYTPSFNANELSSGVYYYRLTAGSFVETKKMLLVR